MMRKAGRYHAVRGAGLAVLLAVATVTGVAMREEVIERDKANYAAGLVGRVFDAPTTQIPGIVKEMEAYRAWTDPMLKEGKEKSANDPRKQLNASLALAPVDAGQLEYLYGRLLKGEPQEVVVIRETLFDHKADLTERLWTLLENPRNDQDQRFRAACALATFTPGDHRWEKAGGDVAATLAMQKPFVIAQWTDALKGVEKWLIPMLADYLVDEKRSVSERGLIATVYGTYATGLPDAYARLEKQLDEKSDPNAPAEAKIALAKRQASIGVALLVMGRGEKVWPLLNQSPDPTMRSYLIDRFAPYGVDPKVLIARLEMEKNPSVKRTVLLSLGEYNLDRLSLDKQMSLLPRLLQMYSDDPDPGIHGAAEWLVRRWRASDELKGIDKKLATGKVTGRRQWYINRQGQTMIVLSKPGEFWMSSGDKRHRKRIDRSFSLASKEVTVEQFLRFRETHKRSKEYAPASDCPVNSVSWYDAAEYCNWLSEQDEIPKKEWCYLPNKEGKYAEGMKMATNYLVRTGYRLPTEAEWEYACRAGAYTEYSYGESEDLLGKYAFFASNSSRKSHSVGSMKPNDLGLFDMQGNVWEWCQDVFKPFSKGGDGKMTEDIEDINDVNNIRNISKRVFRGGSFYDPGSFVRSDSRSPYAPAIRNDHTGFRPARTFSP
jgi:formylglycine-generating enzyme required for sulfatase activity